VGYAAAYQALEPWATRTRDITKDTTR
jgi:hypothetical protein